MPPENAEAEYDAPMRRSILTLSAILLACVSWSTAAQVYRCGNSTVFTDRPCDGATPVDVRPNIMDAGPRQVTPEPAATGAPAIILAVPPKPPQPSGSLWDRRDAAEAEYRSRTGPYRP
jgi:hypothetical protein